MSFLEPGGPIAPALLLLRIEAELAGCRSILAKVENSVETLLQSGNVAFDDPLHVAEMQSIDLLDQVLADLMLCLRDMSGTEAMTRAQPLRPGQVTRHMRLAALRSRLDGFVVAAEQGDGVELF